jgi:HEAT repeat protein
MRHVGRRLMKMKGIGCSIFFMIIFFLLFSQSVLSQEIIVLPKDLNKQNSNDPKELIPKLGKGNLEAEPAIKALIKLGDDAVEGIDAAFEGLNDWGERRAAGVLREIGSEKALRVLIKRLPINHKLGYVVGSAIFEHKEMAIPILLERMEDPDPEMRIRAAEYLSDIGGENMADKLVEMYKNEKDEDVQNRLLKCLGNFESDNIVGFLEDKISDIDKKRTISAIEALSEMTNLKALKILENILISDKYDINVKMVSAYGLAKEDNINAIEYIKTNMQSKDGSIQRLAIRTAGKTHNPVFTDVLLLLLNSVDDSIRHAAIIGLGQAGDERAAPKLKELTNDKVVGELAKQALLSIELTSSLKKENKRK